MDLGRRAFASAAGALGVSALAGCSSLPGGSDDGPTRVTAAEPDGNGRGTVAELRYLIEHEQESIAGDKPIPLTRMVKGEEENYTYVTATYKSEATDFYDFVTEVGVFATSYALYVEAGGDAVTDFTVTVESRYDGQPTSFGIKRKWARKFNSGAKSRNWYINYIKGTFAYPTTSTDAGGTRTNSSARGNKV